MADNKQRSLSSFLNIPSPSKRTENVSTLPAGFLEGTSAETTARKHTRTQEQADAAKRAQHQYYETVTKPKRAAGKALKSLLASWSKRNSLKPPTKLFRKLAVRAQPKVASTDESAA
jgi:hypothetical protein